MVINMSEYNNVPKIRFKGFTDVWEQRELFDVADYRNGKAHENDIDDDGKYIVINSKFVSTEGKIKKYSNKQNEPLFQNEIAFVLSDVPNGRAIAKTFLVDKSSKYTLNQRIAGITPHSNINPKFLSITMNRNKYFLQFDDGVKQTNLSLNDMKKFEEFYPKKQEQDKIGELFTNLDNLITLHQRKCDTLVNVKKSLLEKMFPKNSSNIPEIRFKGFTDVWEQRELFDVADYRNGKAHENDIDDDGKYIVINSKFVSTEGKIKKYSNKQNEPLFQNEIAFVLSDVPNGRAIAKTFLVDKSSKYTLNQRIAGITPHSNINPKFLSITMNRNKYFLQFDDGVKQTNLSLNDMKKFEEFYPKKQEQDKIGELFTNLDNLITLHQRKLEKLNNIKKSMLDKMFV